MLSRRRDSVLRFMCVCVLGFFSLKIVTHHGARRGKHLMLKPTSPLRGHHLVEVLLMHLGEQVGSLLWSLVPVEASNGVAKMLDLSW